MKIKKVQLSGFKSFVDSTAIEIGNDMTGIVGPNGCGKSNIVDAVRWVMGQSARSIRASNIEDVIFGGTDEYKPVGQASVELVFDNEDGTIGGEYASYNEISLKRVAERTRESKYFINNTRCRQRDVSDLFFGTGLGIHSYALIEQGMVSRIIEADPKEMRLYIEEAAGISKYRERRRETELRMRHTRENLDRLLDIRDEVSKQLNKLKRQARSASLFKELRLARDKINVAIASLALRKSEEAVANCQRKLSDLRIELEKRQAELRKYEAEIEEKRTMQDQYNEQLNDVREKFYQLSAQIGGVEQDIQSRSRNAAQIQKEVIEISKSLKKCTNSIQEQEKNRASCLASLAEVKGAIQTASKELADIESSLKDQEIVFEKASREWERQYSDTVEISESLEVVRIKIEYCDRELEEIANQEREVSEQKASLRIDELEKQVKDLHGHRQNCREALEKNNDQINSQRDEIEQSREALQVAERDADILLKQLQEMREEMASLKALQVADEGDAFFRWLEQKNLADLPRLVAKIDSDKEWEVAVETVLGSLLTAVEVDSLEQYVTDVTQSQTDTFAIYERVPDVSAKPNTLASKVRSDSGLNALLNQVQLAESLSQALEMRKRFSESESVITADGVWVGRSWVRAHRYSDKRKSILKRQSMTDELTVKLAKCENDSKHAQEKIGQLKAKIANDVRDFEHAQKQRDQLLEQVSSAEAEWRRAEVRLHHVKDLSAELDDKASQVEKWRDSIEEQRKEHIAKRDSIQTSTPDQSSSKKQRIEAEQKLTGLRESLQAMKDKVHQMEIEKHSLSTQLTGLDENLASMRQQKQDLERRRASLGSTEKGFHDPIESKQSELDSLIEQRQQYEQSVKTQTAQLDKTRMEIEHAQRECRNVSESCDSLLEKRESLRMELQKNQIHCEEFKAQIDKLDMSPEMVSEYLESEVDAENLENELEKVEKRIDKLGPINLIADQEFNELSERKEYIDSQHKDLTSALATLEKAINKIDHESKEKFKNTFGDINVRFKDTFARLFGGGEAHLELMEREWLRGGIAVMVRPPGKRLSSIKLLSGGEKALAALALIFSIFDLNPSPFCMLDEVDAPLDEDNVMRFCELLRDMSERVQFIVITHNRLTMEYMGCLLGVTMGQPGISRMVSVNVDEAVQMADG